MLNVRQFEIGKVIELPQLRVAYEATPLLGVRTGVGEFCYGALDALSRMDGLRVRAFAMSFRRRRLLHGLLPPGVAPTDWVMPARPLHSLWKRSDLPPIELWDRKVDVVHGTNFVVPPTVRAGKVVTVHDLTTILFPQLCHPATLDFPRLIQRAIRAGAFVHTPSRFVAREVMENFDVDPERVVAVHHGIPENSSMAHLEGYQVADLAGKTFILAIGTIEPRKDLPSLVKAFDRVAAESRTDLYLVIAGQDGWGSQALLDTISQARYRGRIMRLGYVTPGMRQWLLGNAVAFVYPSLYEGFGFPPLEAMRFGTPVISSNAGALAEILSAEAAVLFEPGDVDQMAQAIARVSLDKEFAARLSGAGRELAAKFSWDKCADGLRSLYERAAES